MNIRSVIVVVLVIIFASALVGQTKIAGKQHCPKPRALATADAGDEAGHTMTLEKSTCTWLVPFEMVGERATEGTFVAFSESSSTRAATSGTYVGSMENGDKFYIEFHWATLKDGTPAETVKGYCAFTGGTGKLKGITGKGTYTATENENGGGEHEGRVLSTEDGHKCHTITVKDVNLAKPRPHHFSLKFLPAVRHGPSGEQHAIRFCHPACPAYRTGYTTLSIAIPVFAYICR
jgi:hypothetical protein